MHIRNIIGAWFIIFAFISLSADARTVSSSVTITAFGAVGDGKTDCTQAFEKAWHSGVKMVFVPAGTFAVSKVVVPEGATLEGLGNSSVVIPAPAASGPLVTLSPLVTLGGDSIVRRLKFSGGGAKVICLRAGQVQNVAVQEVTIDNFQNMAIETDNTSDMTIEKCKISRVQRASNIQFSHRIHVLNNTVTDCTEHGFQFWGNWKWESKKASDLYFIGNYVHNGGSGAIWGSGAEHVVMSGNVVDGAEDVGLDLEWCDDSVISGNSVRHAANGGIALFFACQGVTITGNTIRNDHPISAEAAKAGWFARAGIWLTYPNRKEFPQDFGHRDVAITGNVIICAEGERRAIWIGSESDNVVLQGNTIRGGKVWQGGADLPMTEIKGDTTITKGEALRPKLS